MPRVKFKGKLLTLTTKTTRLPNGRMATIDLIEHPGAVLIIPFVSKDRIILLRQFRMAVNGYLYELPAGTKERKESSLVCARRELIEETGFAAKRLIKLGDIYPVPGYSTEIITIFKAEQLTPEFASQDDNEIIRSLTVTRSEIQKMFKKGRIKDAKTICALAMCGWI